MLKGSEALALALSGVGLRGVFCAPHTPLRRVERLLSRSSSISGDDCQQALSDNLAVSLALGGALLCRHPTCALLGPAGAAGAMEALSSAALLSEYRSGTVLIDGADPLWRAGRSGQDSRAMVQAAANLPIFEPGSVEEIYHLLRVSFAASEAGGLPAVLRTGPRLLEQRGEVRESRPVTAEADRHRPALSYCRDDGPYLCTAATYRFHKERRERRQQALAQVAAALTSRTVGTGPQRRGVVLAGHLGPRMQAQAAARGLSVLRLGMAWPLPEPLLLEFLGELSEALVLEEGDPFLLTQLQALSHRAGLGVRVVAPEGAVQRLPVTYEDSDLDAALTRFAGPVTGEAGSVPGFDLALAQQRIEALLPPRLDEHGELDEEPWPLYFARLKNKRPRYSLSDPRLHLLTQLRHLPRPTLIVAGPGPAGDLGGPQRLIDVQLHGGSAAPVAGALSRASAVTGLEGEAAGPPLVVALLDGGAGPGSHSLEQLGVLDNARSGRDVLHVLILPSAPEGGGDQEDLLPQLRAAGIDLSSADLHDTEAVTRAVSYAAHRAGPRALLCYGGRGETASSSSSFPSSPSFAKSE